MKAYQVIQIVDYKHTYSTLRKFFRSETLVNHLLFCSLFTSLFLSSYTGNRKLHPTLVSGTLSM